MENIDKDIEKFLEILNAVENSWNTDILQKMAYGTIFFKCLQDTSDNKHYLKCLVQDSLSILDSLCQKSQRYFYFILRSYIENFFRALLQLEDTDATGVMKLFRNGKKIIEKYDEISGFYEKLDEAYSECCLFVHSNIDSGDEINEFLKTILERNDFENSENVNTFLEKFNEILDISIVIFLTCHTEIVDSSFYRKKDILKRILSEKNQEIFRKQLITN
ncbi:hypothetical protein [Bacillus pseudomycoides]|uniref:hypothetical protein n=1 Tax=Bacillus pseudomycoides TaxID=64104 RepID=UPI000BF84E82|nr:hypothetical protein [Bacillus pseudomycoides]MED1536198.1 hypothetical protein [Bacillus pseudomycoides]PFZ87512.1 hypothetical protein COL70_21970 [Bacillus pseudomycoides]PHD16380.1 hypothetical protein COF46_14810 [Bacillus pseudomycoides]